jgi:hypothetical protein
LNSGLSVALIADLARQGVRVVLVTGDDEATARAKATKVGSPAKWHPPGTIGGDLDGPTADHFTIFPMVFPRDMPGGRRNQ